MGRRVSTAVPDQSLLLLKAIVAGVPHTGGRLFPDGEVLPDAAPLDRGRRFPDDVGDVPTTAEVVLSNDRLLFERPAAHAALKVTARASGDSRSRDVSVARIFQQRKCGQNRCLRARHVGRSGRHACFFARFSRFTTDVEVIVLPTRWRLRLPQSAGQQLHRRAGFRPVAKVKSDSSELCDDETFLCRVTLDLVARPPTPAEYREFMADPSANKRSRKIDALPV